MTCNYGGTSQGHVCGLIWINLHGIIKKGDIHALKLSQIWNGLYRGTAAKHFQDRAQALSVIEYFAALKVLMGQLSGTQSAEQRGRLQKLIA